jgi:hypothetical protein
MSAIVGPKVLQTASFKHWICHFQWLCCTSRAISQACWRGPSLLIKYWQWLPATLMLIRLLLWTLSSKQVKDICLQMLTFIPTLFFMAHQSPGYFDHVLEVIVIIFKTYFENNQNILTSSLSMGFLPIKLLIIIISSFSNFSFIYFSTFVW